MLSLLALIPYNRCRLGGLAFAWRNAALGPMGEGGGMLVRSTLLLTALMASGAAAATVDAGLPDAAKSQDQKMVQALLSQHADVNARSDDGSTALLWAAHWNNLDTAALLLHAGADANAANDFQMTPLSQA